ncbi:hypothetical protein GSH19_03960 [Lactobacillus sp. S2-2]|uniref:Ig-like domain-containing protein n=1 Tax=Lactobacillus sp. S2-2 TaxID=2692917 RepID=UPI001F29506D|nr:Ig-like domain-containing protein [Lactobacillus sp. S2-2]MCF6515309.1 hypothetical protein [Lactobacillus sp. S2-2]
MKKIILKALAGFMLIASLGLGVSAKSNTKIAQNSPSLNVNAIYSNSNKVSGKATKGSLITVKTKNKKVLAKTYASKTNGNFELDLPSKQKAATQLYVYANKVNSKSYFYRIIHVQQKGKATTKKTTKKTSKKATTNKKITGETLEGSWNSSFNKSNQSQRLIFDNNKGMSLQFIKNDKVTSTKFSHATYNLKIGKSNFASVKYRLKGQKQTCTTYLRFTSNNSFILVNSSNKPLQKGFYNSSFTQFTR